jgi:hypothetical protein
MQQLQQQKERLSSVVEHRSWDRVAVVFLHTDEQEVVTMQHMHLTITAVQVFT